MPLMEKGFRSLLDTGFTTGWLAINSQDIEALEWPLIEFERVMKTARGEESFDIYEGKLLLDGQEFLIEVVAGPEITENILGLQWLRTHRLLADFPSGVLTLG